MKILSTGVNFDALKQGEHGQEDCSFPDPSFVGERTDAPRIFAFLDNCHMLKLIRNHFGRNRLYFKEDGQEEKVADFKYLEALVALQEKEGGKLNLRTKLSKKHIEFNKSIMNVKLAVETMSRSTAQALIFAKNNYGAPFQDVDLTVELILQADEAFDLLNSRSIHAPL